MLGRRAARPIVLALLFTTAVGPAVRAGDWPEWPLRRKAAEGSPNSLEQIARSIDSIEDKILDDGTVVLKQPDVYSQSRMTLYRKNFEAQLYNAIGMFNTVLSARVFRSDQAAFSSQSNLAASAATAKSKAGSTTTTNTTVSPPQLISPGTSGGVTPDGLAPNSIVRPNNLSALGPTPFSQGFASPTNSYGLGVEPTVFLDELKRYQDHLNQLRRVNMGDDISDSAGYGLYLIRMPISIQPGELTLKGHGAILTATLRHDFGTEFLASTYRNLVINDLVDQLSPMVFELIRSDALMKIANLKNLDEAYDRYIKTKWRSGQDVDHNSDFEFIYDRPRGDKHRPERAISSASITLNRINARNYPIAPTEMYDVFGIRNLYILALHAKDALGTKTPRATDVRTFLRRELESAYDIIAQTFGGNEPESLMIARAYEDTVEVIARHVR
jgi:hypothetical protein